MYATKVQTPMGTSLLKESRKLAEDLGLSSVNDLIRLLLKKATKGELEIRVVAIDQETKRLRKYRQELDKEVEETKRLYKQGKLKAFTNAEDLMADLNA